MSTPNNYAPPQSVVADIPSTDTPFEKATRLSRLAAVLLDIVIFSVPLIPLYMILFSMMFHARTNMRNFPALWLSAVAGAGVLLYVGLLVYIALLVVTIMLVYRNAQTIGKKLVGIKVARTDGSRASLARGYSGCEMWSTSWSRWCSRSYRSSAVSILWWTPA